MLSLLVLLATLSSLPPAPAGALPARVPRKGEIAGPPLWISVEEALSPDGTLHEEEFTAWVRASFPHQLMTDPPGASLETPPEECRRRGASAFDHLPTGGPDSSLEELTASAGGIYRGTMSAVSVGFLDGLAGSLLEVTVEETIKGKAGAERIWVYYPYALAKRGRTSICRIDYGYTLRPARGGHVLFFALWPARDDGGRLFEPGPRHLLLEAGAGDVVSDPSFKEPVGPASFEAIASRVRERAGANEER